MIEQEKKGRKLVWHDEFDKPTIDFNKWNFKRTMNGNDRIYENSEKHARIENGKLHLSVHKTDDKTYPWSLSEGLATAETMLFKYGYLEMRAKVPFRHGAWPSFWLQSKTPFTSVPWFSEVDIFEVFSSTDTIIANLHKWGENHHTSLDFVTLNRPRSYTFQNPQNLNDEYHIFGFEWDCDYMCFYADGKMFAKFPISESDCEVPNDTLCGTKCFHDPHFIILNNELFTPKGSYSVKDYNITDSDKLPIEYTVDWVRLYQKAGEEIILKDEIAQKSNL